MAWLKMPERFWAKVDKAGPPSDHAPDLGPCWLWTACTDKDGYGDFWLPRGPSHTQAAHRVAYELEVGPIPDGLEIDHLCRTPACVRPSHLEPVDSWTNFWRGQAPSAIAARSGLCPRGHVRHRQPSGAYACKPCANERARRTRVRSEFGRGDRQRLRTHCPRGHPYTGSNLMVGRDQKRRCRQCYKDRYYAKRGR